jgi:hypothetical protein
VGWNTQGVSVVHEASDGLAGILVQKGDEGNCLDDKEQRPSPAGDLKRAVTTISIVFFLDRNVVGRFM